MTKKELLIGILIWGIIYFALIGFGIALLTDAKQ
jgi:hypothetical protein